MVIQRANCYDSDMKVDFKCDFGGGDKECIQNFDDEPRSKMSTSAVTPYTEFIR